MHLWEETVIRTLPFSNGKSHLTPPFKGFYLLLSMGLGSQHMETRFTFLGDKGQSPRSGFDKGYGFEQRSSEGSGVTVLATFLSLCRDTMTKTTLIKKAFNLDLQF